MKELKTEIEIISSPEKVWQILTDFENYPDWNPFIKKIEGDLKEGNQISVFIEPPGSKGMMFKPQLKKLEPNKELRWLGRLIIPKLFDGEHIFKIQQLDETTVKFIHKENFGGLLAPLIWKKLNTETRKGFEMMNIALKERVEKM